MKVVAIIVAAGSGRRLGHPLPKALVPLGPYPILHYPVRTLSRVAGITEVIVTTPADRREEAREITQRAAPQLSIKIVAGGVTRQESVRIALGHSRADADIVVIHDAARPFASARLFIDCIEAARRAGAAATCIPLADTLKQAADGVISATRKRDGWFQAQTPQAFTRSLLMAAHSRAGADDATDDAGMVEGLGSRQVAIVAGSTLNFKITTAEDLRLARALLAGDPALSAQFR